jgi:hypothetical protein
MMKEPDLISNMKDSQQSIVEKLKHNSSSSSLKNDITLSMEKINVLKCDNQIKELHTVLRDR